MEEQTKYEVNKEEMEKHRLEKEVFDIKKAPDNDSHTRPYDKKTRKELDLKNYNLLRHDEFEDYKETLEVYSDDIGVFYINHTVINYGKIDQNLSSETYLDKNEAAKLALPLIGYLQGTE